MKGYEILFNASPDAMIKIDMEQIILEANPSFEELFLYGKKEIAGKHIDDVLRWNQGERLKVLSNTRKVLGGKVFHDRGVRKDKNGNEYHVMITGIPIVDQGICRGAFLIYRNVNRETRALRELNQQKVIFEALFKNSSDAIVLFDENHLILDINDHFTSLFGYTVDEIKGWNLDHAITIQKTLQTSANLTNQLLRGEKVVTEGVRYGKNGNPVEVQIKGVPIVDGKKVIGGYGIYTDISDRKRIEKEILYVSYHDALTGLYNRRFMDAELERLNTKRNHPISFIMGDVNGLKLTNDVFGHQAGDDLLKKVASVLRKACREDELIARIGGDEFLIVLPKTTKEMAEVVVDRIQRLMANMSFQDMSISISFGYDMKEDPAERLEELYKHVEDLMYKQKLEDGQSLKKKMFDTIVGKLHNSHPEEKEHGDKVAYYSEKIGQSLGFNQKRLDRLVLTAKLHDVGKISLAEETLKHHWRETVHMYPEIDSKQWKEYAKHMEAGYRIFNNITKLADLSEFVLYHHERFDGLGYPRGIKGKSIPLEARIIAVANEADLFRREFSGQYSEGELHKKLMVAVGDLAGSILDPALVEIFEDAMNHSKDFK